MNDVVIHAVLFGACLIGVISFKNDNSPISAIVCGLGALANIVWFLK